METNTIRLNTKEHEYVITGTGSVCGLVTCVVSYLRKGVMTEDNIKRLEELGFCFNRSGGHSARTIIMNELELLFSHVKDVDAPNQASAILMPVSCRRELIDLSDEMATKVDVQFYSDARDALLKAITE